MSRIINIASGLGTKLMEESVAYCTSEVATIMLTQNSFDKLKIAII